MIGDFTAATADDFLLLHMSPARIKTSQHTPRHNSCRLPPPPNVSTHLSLLPIHNPKASEVAAEIQMRVGVYRHICKLNLKPSQVPYPFGVVLVLVLLVLLLRPFR